MYLVIGGVDMFYTDSHYCNIVTCTTETKAHILQFMQHIIISEFTMTKLITMLTERAQLTVSLRRTFSDTSLFISATT